MSVVDTQNSGDDTLKVCMQMSYNTGMNWKEVMTIFGYWRCSTDLQDQERQVLALRNAGAEVIYGDKITGTSEFNSRPADLPPRVQRS